MALAALTFAGNPCRRGHNGTRYAKSGHCVECSLAKASARRLAKPEQCREADAAWRKANPERSRAHSAKYRAGNREREVERGRTYRAAYPGQRRESMAIWRKENAASVRDAGVAYRRTNKEKERIRHALYSGANLVAGAARAALRLARKRNAPGRGVTTAEWRNVLAESLGLCAYCNERKPLSMDHIEPLAGGGSHDIENIAAVCRSCNSSKQDTSLLVWLAKKALARAA